MDILDEDKGLCSPTVAPVRWRRLIAILMVVIVVWCLFALADPHVRWAVKDIINDIFYGVPDWAERILS